MSRRRVIAPLLRLRIQCSSSQKRKTTHRDWSFDLTQEATRPLVPESPCCLSHSRHSDSRADGQSAAPDDDLP
jgi:hypothetical protein